MAALDSEGQSSRRKPVRPSPDIQKHFIFMFTFISQRLSLHLTEYNWPVFSDMSRLTTVFIVFFDVMNDVCVSVVFGVYLMYQNYLR